MSNSKSQKLVLDRIIQRQGWALDSVSVHLNGLEKTAKEMRRNLSLGGQASWSCNHDILRWAQILHKLSYELYILTNLRETISAEEKKSNEKSKPKTKKGK